MKRWAFSLLTYQKGDTTSTGNVHFVGVNSHMSCAVLEATSEDEARGKALRIAVKLYPPDKGFGGHQVSVSDVNNVVDLENVAFVPQ